jgi:MerR family transcriptional regulator, light-induced transcriptional regulator
MDTSLSARPIMLSIAAVERDTGLSKDTLRVWERRYGFPIPARDSQGERSYPFDQLERLRTIKRLLDAGHRPGRVVALEANELDRLSLATGVQAPIRSTAQAPTTGPDLAALMACIERHDTDTLRRDMARALSRFGLGRFVLDVVAPLNLRVGEAWMQGRLAVFEEHLYTESVQVVLRNALHHLPPSTGGPRVLLGTVPGEPHGLGLLMAEALLALEGCHSVSLGVQTPIWDIVRAAMALRSDVVALSYTGCTNPNQVIDGLAELRNKLPARVALWAGGSAPVLQRRAIDGVRVMPTLASMATALADWHARHPASMSPTVMRSP